MSRPARPARHTLRNLAFLSPWLVGTGLFFLYPLVATAYLSFTHYDGFTSPRWTGLRNWTYVVHDYPFFWPAMRNTLWLVVVIVTLRMLFGLAVAMLVIRVKRGGGFFRTLYYAPYLAPPVAGTIAFVFLLNPGTGRGEHHPRPAGAAAAGVVQRPCLVEAVADAAGAVVHR